MRMSVLARVGALVVASMLGAVSVAGAQAAQATQPPKPAGGHAGHHGAAAKDEEAHHAIPWKALDSYHTVMAASWHPAKDKNDLAPFRAKAGDFVAAARALVPAEAPAACARPSLAGDVAALIASAEEAAKAARTAGVADADVKAALKLAHDRFHAVEEACTGGGKGGMKH